ncbi:MAG: DUF3375 family protein [Candidatus Gracilibacteria bacterium]|nr:DUF3375 family protein [Candidatus Gracilibacteria bacterium]
MGMILKEKFSSPVIKLFRSENLDFILSFFYFVFRNTDKQIDVIRQSKLEKELKTFIKDYNFELVEEKNEENASKYIETWIKSRFLRRIEVNEFGDDYDIELTEDSLQVMNFVDNLGLDEDLLHASVKSNFENILNNLKFIAFSSESYKKQNIEEIDKQIKDLEKKKNLIKIGDLSVFEEEVYDKYNSAKDLLKKMPIEFRRVESVFEGIYRSLQKKSNETDLNRGQILGEILDEIEEKINNSPQGKSFDGFEKFYRDKTNDFFDSLEKVFEKFEKIQILESQKSIKSMINIDLLKAKKRAYNKKTFLVSKLREIFNEENLKERKKGVDLIKQIKKIVIDNQSRLDFKKDFFEINSGLEVDLFMGKNLWEPSSGMKLSNYESIDKVEREIDVENIFRYTSISEKQVIDNIGEVLKEKNEAYLEDVLESFPIKYSIDEFMSYFKVAIYDSHEVSELNTSYYAIKGIHNDLEIESPRIKFKK